MKTLDDLDVINKIYDETNVLKVRLHSLVNSDDVMYFDYPEYITREQYIRSLMLVGENRKAQIINFNINYVDDRFAKTLTKIYSRLFFEYASNGNEPYCAGVLCAPIPN